MRFNLIRNIRQFIKDVKQAINDPYVCASEEGKQMWREIEEWQKNHDETLRTHNSENENQSSE